MKYRDKILKRLDEKKEPDRGPVTLYFTKEIYERFKKACKPRAASVVLEEMMKDFLEK